MTVLDDTREFSWMLAKFVEQTPGVQGAVAVSSDGILMAMSAALTRRDAEPVEHEQQRRAEALDLQAARCL